MTFKNSAVEEKYTATVEKDVEISGHSYSGLLSNISLSVADDAFKNGSQFLKLKDPSTAVPASGKK